jgi:hypothetical protein
MKRNLLLAALTLVLNAISPAFGQSVSFTTNITSLATNAQVPTLADFNGDGKMDFVVGDPGDSEVLLFTNNGSGSFGLYSTLLTAGTSPVYIAAADINNDGKPDLISADATDGRLVVFTNNGIGGFSQSFSNALGGLNLNSVAVADVNNDGRLDIITAGKRELIYTNGGNGTFGSNATLNVPVQSFQVIATDVNNDGKIDLVFADGYTSTITVLTNQGAGVFGSNATLQVQGNFYSIPADVAAADINGDGKVDLVAATLAYPKGFLTIFTNNGSGAFGSNTTVDLPFDQTASEVFVADMNGDGKPDLVTPGYNYAGSPLINIFTNGGAIDFSFCTSAAADPNATIAVADINNDGKPDIISVGAANGTLTTYIQNSTSRPPTGFAPAVVPAGSNPLSLVVADINNDGKPDIITANSGDGTLSVLTNNGAGIFGANTNLLVGSVPSFAQPYAVTAADINNDGKLDLVSANFNDDSLTIYTNRGGGVFVSNTTVSLPSGSRPYALAAADLNNDGKVDLVAANWGGQNIYVLYNNGSGGFGVSATLTTGTTPTSVAAADFNNDGKLDLACVCASSSTLVIYTNRGGSFGSNTTINLGLGAGPQGVVATDVNLDGKMDLITANFNANTLTVFTNNGSGVFGSNATLHVDTNPQSVFAADINADGKVDLIAANHNGNTLTVFTNNGSGTFGFNTTIYLPNAYPGTVMAADVNRDGKLDLVVVDQVNAVTVLTQVMVPPPRLAITPTATNTVVVSWSSYSTSLVLQTNSDLFTANWTSPGSSVSVSNATNQSATVPSSSGKLFFRLSQ